MARKWIFVSGSILPVLVGNGTRPAIDLIRALLPTGQESSGIRHKKSSLSELASGELRART